jgi:CCR4-NOT transcriptional regulation complex NOT5 subunit
VTFILTLLLASGVIWWLVDWVYASRIQSKDAVIEMLNANAKASRAEKREKLEQEVLQLKAKRPGISIKPAIKVGMDEDDVREEQIKIKERRIIE